MLARLPMKRSVVLAGAAIISLWMQTACRPMPPVAVDQTPTSLAMPAPSVPQHVRRLAVWYPSTFEQEVAYGYSRLEQAAFQLKRQRSWIRIVERRNIEPLTNEQ